MKKYFLGIDEAGRGPWAWPLVVAGICVQSEKFLDEIPFLTDSKKLSEKRRNDIFHQIFEMEKEGILEQKIIIQSAEIIDTIGICEANRRAMQEIISFFEKKFSNISVKIDGSDNFFFEKLEDFGYTYAIKKSQKQKSKGNGAETLWKIREECSWKNIEFIIGGDAKNKLISLASILAKVTRDCLMIDYAQEFPDYGFEKHKGYGTKKHHEAILNYGINSLHRKSFEPIKTLISGASWLW